MITSFIEVCGEFPVAVLCGCLLAVTCGSFGVFVLMRRLGFISIALSECSACGIAAASLCGFPPLAGATTMTLLAVCALSKDWERLRIPRDAILGAVFVFASALSVLLVSRSGMGLLEVKALLYGDLLLASSYDLMQIAMIHVPLLACLLLFLRSLLFSFMDNAGARVAGIPVRALELAFFVALGMLISSAAKMAGSLLVFCYLVVPPATGLLLSRRLWAVMLLASISGVLATFIGLTASYHWDLAGNQCIIIAACVLLVLLPSIKTLAMRLSRHALGPRVTEYF